uniref:Uncharacterized protein n=1 Tax=Anopheles atroparvus TaxID=41427 RepID=A0A182J8M1_ANOAO
MTISTATSLADVNTFCTAMPRKRGNGNGYGHALGHLPIARIATIFTTPSGGSHSDTNASTAYCANDRQMIAIWDGLSTSVETHENRKAGHAPNASIKYAHSAPDEVFIVPNSAPPTSGRVCACVGVYEGTNTPVFGLVEASNGHVTHNSSRGAQSAPSERGADIDEEHNSAIAKSTRVISQSQAAAHYTK